MSELRGVGLGGLGAHDTISAASGRETTAARTAVRAMLLRLTGPGRDEFQVTGPRRFEPLPGHTKAPTEMAGAVVYAGQGR